MVKHEERKIVLKKGTTLSAWDEDLFAKLGKAALAEDYEEKLEQWLIEDGIVKTITSKRLGETLRRQARHA